MEELNEFLVPEINEVAKAEGFEDFTLTCSKAANIGDESSLLRVTIKGLRQIDGALVDKSTLSVLIKMPLIFQAIPKFQREALFYSKYYPMLVQFQHDRGITEEADGFFAVPKCYKVISDVENEHYALIMEDLNVAGYQMFNNHKTIDLQHVTLVLRNLARMHALSLVMRDQQPEMFNEVCTLREQTMENDVMTMHVAIDKAIIALGPLEEFKVEKLQKLKSEAVKTFQFCSSGANAEPFAVLSHGDCWNNNMLYSYDEEGEPNKIRLVDFQQARYGSPANDVVSIIFTSTNEELRDDHYESLLKIYHQSLCDFVTLLGSDGESLFKYNDFKKQMKKFGRFGLLMSVMRVPMMEAAFDKMNMDKANSATGKEYNKRITGVVRDIIRLGYY